MGRKQRLPNQRLQEPGEGNVPLLFPVRHFLSLAQDWYVAVCLGVLEIERASEREMAGESDAFEPDKNRSSIEPFIF